MHPQVPGEQSLAEEFIQKAVSKGLEEICITDHMPLSISDAPDRIPVGRVGEYAERVSQLAE